MDGLERDSAAASEIPRPVIGSLANAIVKVLSPVQIAVLVATLVVVGVLLWVGLYSDGFAELVLAVGDALGTTPAIWLFAVAGWILFALCVAAIAFLPPLLLRGADRRAVAVHSWLGAREVRRAFGRASRAADVLGTPAKVSRWLERTPATGELASVRVEALLLVGRFDDARTEAERLPARTPLETYRRAESLALVGESTGRPLSADELRAAAALLPSEIDRTEAAVSLAVMLARRALPDGDWRRPLLEVRHLIPETDAVLLTRDFGLTIFDALARRVLLPFLVLILGLAALLTLAPALGL